jgi:hypothetical protein
MEEGKENDRKKEMRLKQKQGIALKAFLSCISQMLVLWPKAARKLFGWRSSGMALHPPHTLQ